MNNTTHTPTLSQTTTIITTIGFVVVSIPGIFGSIVTISVITSTKALRTPCFLLIAGSGIGSFAVAVHYLIRAIDRIGSGLGYFQYQRITMQCLSAGVFGFWEIPFHALLSSIIAFDRLISVAAPNQYRFPGIRYAVIALIACAIFITLLTTVGYATAPSQSVLMCASFLDALNSKFNKAFVGFILFLSALNVIAYGAMVICFRLKQKLAKTDNLQDPFLKQQLAVVPTVKLIMICYFFSGVLSEIVVNIGVQIPPSELAFLLNGIGGILRGASSSVEVVSLMLKNQRFRDRFRVIISCRSNAVVPSAPG